MDFINGRFYPKLMGCYNFGDGDRCSWGGNALIGLDWGWGKPWTFLMMLFVIYLGYYNMQDRIKDNIKENI